MHPRSLRLSPLFAFLLCLGFAALPRALAVTNDELLPENLIGKTFRFTHNAASPNSLEPAVNSYAITFNSSTTYTRTGAGLGTVNGTYSVLITFVAPNTNIRLTTLGMSNWYGTPGGAMVSLNLTHAAGIGAFAANETLNPLKNSGGLMTIDGSSPGGGGATDRPTIISGGQASATVGTPFTFQIIANNVPTSYGATGLPAGLTVNPATGLISGTPTTAGAFTVSLSATNAIGTGTAALNLSVSGGASGGGGGGGSGGSTTGTPATSVTAWGWNLSGQTTVPAGLTNVIAAAGSSQAAFSLRADGTVAAWGQSTQTTPPAGLSGVTAIAAGSSHVVALKSDGSLVMWGNSADGQRTGLPTSGTFTAISAAYFHSLAVRSDGTVASWGSDPAWGPLVQPPAGLTGVRAVAAGVGYDLALKTDGTVVAWASPRMLADAGTNKGQATVPAGLGGVVAIAAGQFHALALRSDGVVIGWGGSRNGAANSFSVPAAAQSGVIAIACGLEHSLVLKSNGTVVAWGNNSFGEANVPASLANVTRIAAGEYFSIALVGGTAPAPGSGGGGGGSGGGGGGGGGVTPPTIAAAPSNLVGYRNRVGQTFEFTVTGTASGAVWGTDVYTDDSTVARAAVHAGVVAVGETKNVTVTILGGQGSYPASTRNGVSSASWGAWPGSYAFAGASGGTATARPALATGFTAGTGTLAVGGRFICPIVVTGGGTYTYQWYLNGLAIAGATSNPYVVASVSAANAGTYTVDVTNALGTTRLTAGTLTVGAAGSPVIALQPLSKVAVPGATVTFATNATGTGLTYQWFRNNVALAGETGPVLLRQNIGPADAGTYTVRVSNASGSVTSTGGTLTLSPNASRPANISVRTNVATGAIVTPGFVIQGSGTKRVLIRAVGPGLGAFNIGGAMANPKLTVFEGQTQIAENDNWSAANVGDAFTATGAFALTPGSQDAALVTDLAAGRAYTVQVTHATGSGGIVLIEVYDADVLRGTSTSKLINVSVRGQTAPGEDILTLGLVIGGTGQRTLLVRGIGPKLAAFGVTGTVGDPQLQIFDSQQRPILANDNWNSADFVDELVLATNYVGAFALDAGSRDAATLSLVEPGAYTIQVGGVGGTSGEALVEVYEVP